MPKTQLRLQHTVLYTDARIVFRNLNTLDKQKSERFDPNGIIVYIFPQDVFQESYFYKNQKRKSYEMLPI